MNRVVGVDVAKDRLDVCALPEGETATFKAGEMAKFTAWILKFQPELVVMEASGGYERSAWSTLAAKAVPVAVVNPKRVRDFGRALGLLAKTDQLDARVLADFGRRVEPPATPVPSPGATRARSAARSISAGYRDDHRREEQAWNGRVPSH